MATSEDGGLGRGIRQSARRSRSLSSVRPSGTRLRSASSLLLSRTQFARSFNLPGLTFAGRRNVYEALGYSTDLTPEQYRFRYERGGIAERIVEAYPRATWVDGTMVYEDPAPDTSTDFEQDISSLFSKFDLWARLLRVDILSRLGEYGVFLIGAPDDLNKEIPSLRSIDDIIYITPLAQDRARIKTWVEDSKDPRFGLPAQYEVNISPLSSSSLSSSTSLSGKFQPCHWSRIIHVAEGTLESDLIGKPALRAVWNYLDDLDKIVGGGSEAAWKRMDPGLHADIDPEMVVDEAEQDLMEDDVEEYQNGLSRFIQTRGVKLTPLSASVSNFGANADTLLQLISSVTAIPLRILIGSERGELASSQDKFNSSDRVSERRREFATPLIRQLVDRLIKYGAVRKPVEYNVSWPDIEELDESGKAEVAGKIATANKNQTDARQPIIMSSDEIREKVYGLEPLAPQKPIDTQVGTQDPSQSQSQA